MKYAAKIQKFNSSIGFYWTYYAEDEKGNSYTVESIENAKYFPDKRALHSKVINDSRFKGKIMVIEELI